MKITCNGEYHDIPEGLALVDYLKKLELDPSAVVVEYNGQIIDRTDYDKQVISEGAKLELIRFVPGG
ncbi:MAG: sulfur carrier protein ThiS [Thermodesulfobacteriota bacterium]